MRIISKFHDYYDTAQGHGFDPKLIFKRKTEEIGTYTLFKRDFYTGEHKEFPYEIGGSTTEKINPQWPQMGASDLARYLSHFLELCRIEDVISLDVEPFILGFCGSYFLGYRITWSTDHNSVYRSFYDVVDFLRYIGVNNLKKWPKKRFNKKSKKVDGKRLLKTFPTPEVFVKGVRDLFGEIDLVDGDDIFLDLETPIFVLRNDPGLKSYREPNVWALEKNPSLQDYDFYQVYGAYHTYQEIAMYLGGVLVNDEDRMVSLSDEDRINAKGFDKKSFRKEPTKKRKFRKG